MRRGALRRAPHSLAVSLMAVAVAACVGPLAGPEEPGPVQGEGAVVSEDRTAGEFSRVSVGGGMTVAIMEGSPTRVTLSAQPNLLPLVTTDVIDGQLVVNIESPGISTTQPVALILIAPGVESVALSGGADGSIDTTGDTLLLDVSGGATLRGTGSTDALELRASTGASAWLGDLVANAAIVDVAEGAEAELNVVSSLTGEVSGGSSITLAATPAKMDVETATGGMIVGGPAASG